MSTADRLRKLADGALGPWSFNPNNHLVVSRAMRKGYEPQRVAFVDNEEDLPLIAAAPDMARLLADALDLLVMITDDLLPGCPEVRTILADANKLLKDTG